MEKLNIEKFNPTKQELTKMAEKYKGLIIKGIDDKDGYIAVHQARMQLKNSRVQIDKTGKELRSEALLFQKKVIAIKKELIDLISPVEKELEDKQKYIDEEKEKIKRKALIPERQKMMKKINVEIADEFLLTMDDRQFNEYLSEKSDEYMTKREKKLKEEQEKVEADKRKIEDDKRIEQIKKEAEKKVIEDERQRVESEKQKAIQEEELKIENEKKENERLGKVKTYQDFLKTNGYTEATKGDFQVKKDGDKITLFKKIGEIIIK